MLFTIFMHIWIPIYTYLLTCFSSVNASAARPVRNIIPAGSPEGSCGGCGVRSSSAGFAGRGRRCWRTHSQSMRSSKQPRVRLT